MDQVVRRRYGSRKQTSSSMTSNNDNICSNASISVRSSYPCLVSPSRRRRQLTVGRKSLEVGTEKENGFVLRRGRSEDEEEDEDIDDDVDLEGQGFQTKGNTWTSLETSTIVNANFKPSFSTLIWLAQVMTAFSLFGMVFMVRIGSEIMCFFPFLVLVTYPLSFFLLFQILLAILVDAQPFYIAGITTKDKHHRVSTNAIHCSMAYGITAAISYYVSLYPHQILHFITNSLRRFRLIFLLPFTTQYTPTYFYKRRIRRSYSALASTTTTPTTTNSISPPTTSDHGNDADRYNWISSPWRMLRPKAMVYHHELPLYQTNASSFTVAPTTVKRTKASTSAISIPTSTSSLPPSSSRYYQNADAAMNSFWSTAAFRNISSSFNDGKVKKSKKKR